MNALNDLNTKLELLVDRYTLRTVLESLAGVCAEKSDHIRASYDDAVLARIWNAAGVRIAEVASNPHIGNVS